jgi:hypothetical protein
MFGFKVAKNFWGYDLSLSYFYGRDYLPLVNSVNFIPVDTLGMVDVSMEFIYPRIQVFGMDMAGALGKVGIWVEGALFFPKKVEMTTDITGLGMGALRSTALNNKPYIKYVVGADYTFKNGWYINGQYLHGFIHERGGDMLGDYFVFAVEKRLLNDKLKIIPIGGGVEIKDFSDIKNNYALIFVPEVTYFPFDNAEINFGFRILEGKETTTFGGVKDNDEVYLRVKYSF